ncbi:MAG: hypothetical protein U1C74_00090 [Phenylobacterium sp.]|nr:hypothetical protein [Phenylobacterium sp.]
MDDHLAYFLELRLRLRGRSEAIALVDRCIRLVAWAEGARAEDLPALEREVEALRQDLLARFGVRPAVRVH